MTDLLDVDGPAAPPRSNGELVFDAPWEARVFGLAAAVVETRFDGDREPFRQRLIAAIAADPERPYWESWAVALEDLVTTTGLLPTGAVDAAVAGRNPSHS
ncbi:MAG: nitrile hydratase subunit beta [Acidimicrobiia bacterium]|nr:nitrile hydratase subunit beta [Acidimicrobiia bacterium]